MRGKERRKEDGVEVTKEPEWRGRKEDELGSGLKSRRGLKSRKRMKERKKM